MNDTICALVNDISPKDLLRILRNCSSDKEIGDYVVQAFACAFCFSSMDDDDIKDILKRLDTD